MCYTQIVTAKKQQKFVVDRLFRALADPTRLRLIHLMARQEICVCYLVEVLQASQPKISRHLAYLRRTGLVAARREGKWMHYRLVVPSQPRAAAILETTIKALRQGEQFQRDWECLKRACCGPRSLVQLLGAPRPSTIRA